MAIIFRDLAAEAPDKLMLSDGQRELTRAAFNDRVNRLMALLAEYGLGEDGRAAIMAGNSSDFLVAAIAVTFSNASLVPINWHLTADEAAYLARSSRCSVLFHDGERAAAAREIAERAGDPVLIDLSQFDDLLAGASANEPPDRPVASMIFYTSGTTGLPKATKMAQLPKGVSAEALEGRAALLGGSGTDVHLTVGPLYHAGPLPTAYYALLSGSEVRVMRRFDPEEALALIDQHRVTSSLMVPIHFVRFLKLPAEVRARYDVSSLKTVTHIAATVPPDVKRAMIEWWGPVIFEGYGSSEVGAVTLISSEDWLAHPGSVGQASPGWSFHIVDSEDRELPPGEVGMIYIESHTDLDISYLDDPERTAAVHRAPKQFTIGDMGWLDEEGYLYLADRRVDLIISGGVNIYPAEVENALLNHPAVDDVGVFAVPDPDWGHAVQAAVEIARGYEPGPRLEAEILEWARGHLAGFKIPKRIEFVDALPRFENGKLHRRLLRAPYWGDAQDVPAPLDA